MVLGSKVNVKERGERRERVVKEVKGKWVRMLQTELEGGRGIHNTSGEFKKVISKSRSIRVVS